MSAVTTNRAARVESNQPADSRKFAFAFQELLRNSPAREIFGIKVIISSMQNRWPIQFDLSWLVFKRPVTVSMQLCDEVNRGWR
jgi:hypothetical protein